MSDTPISDSTPHNVADLGMLCRRLERQLNAANERIKQLEEMYEGVIGERPEFLGSNVMGLLKRELTGTQKRIKRLEAAGNALLWYFCPKNTGDISFLQSEAIKQWNKAKEAKL